MLNIVFAKKIMCDLTIIIKQQNISFIYVNINCMKQKDDEIYYIVKDQIIGNCILS